MPEKRKEVKSCHDCGLESLGDCEERAIHRPSDEFSAPCKFCSRNIYTEAKNRVTDFYSESWTLSQDEDGHFSPIIEDPTRFEREELLKRLKKICGGERHEQD